MRKDINKDINIKNKNQNNLKRIFLTNNNNFIRLDKMKNNLNGEYFYKNQNMTVPSNKIDKDISPNYNTYKNNYLERLTFILIIIYCLKEYFLHLNIKMKMIQTLL